MGTEVRVTRATALGNDTNGGHKSAVRKEITMRYRVTWKSASDYGKEYDVELLNRRKSYYSSGHLMEDAMRVRFDNGWETSIEMWEAEIVEASEAEMAILDNPIIWRAKER